MSFSYIPQGSVEIPEIPFQREVRLPPRETALVIVDMQNDFIKEGGSLKVAAAAETVPRIAGLLEAARQAGAQVAFTQDTGVQGDPEWEIWPEHCRQGSWGWEIIEELEPRPEELICLKNRYDGFYGSWLEHFLSHVWRVKHLVIVGTVANICVLHTAASAGLRWFHFVMPADGISALNAFDQALTLRQASFLYSGELVRSTSDIVFG